MTGTCFAILVLTLILYAWFGNECRNCKYHKGKSMPDRITIKPYDTYDVSTFVIQGDIIYLSHFGGSYDDEGNQLSSAEEQTIQAFRNLEKALKQIDVCLENLLKVTVILKDIADFDAMHKAWKQIFTSEYPVRTTITSNFVDDFCRVQIDGIACVNKASH